MSDFFRKHWKKFAAAAAVIAALAIAFCFGGNTPGSRGGSSDSSVSPGGQLSGTDSASGTNETSGTDSGAPSCTISISCATLLDNIDHLTEGKETLVPADGWLLEETTVPLEEGESVFDLLQRVTRENGIHMESSFTPMYNSAYIEGIGNLYEFDCGELSGWMYSVNGEFPNYGCSAYTLSDGDAVRWVYTCDLGADVGGDGVVQG